MLSQINKQLDSIVSDIRHQKRLHYILRMNEQRLRMAKISLKKADEKTEKALSKFQKLEKHSAKSAMFNLIGKREAKLEEEERKYHSVKKRRDQIATKITDINQEIYVLNQQLEALKPLTELEKDLVKLKEDFLVANDSVVFDLTKKITELKIDAKELKEAWEVAYLYNQDIVVLMNALEYSFTWKGLAKAANIARKLQKRSKRLEVEIIDVIERMEIKLEINPYKLDRYWEKICRRLEGNYEYDYSREGGLHLLNKHRLKIIRTMNVFKSLGKKKRKEIKFTEEKRQILILRK